MVFPLDVAYAILHVIWNKLLTTTIKQADKLNCVVLTKLMLAIDSERILTGFACQLGLLGYGQSVI